MTQNNSNKPIVSADALVSVYQVILSNAEIQTAMKTVNGRKSILATTDDENLFIHAYQAICLATPYCYDLEPYDGEIVTISYRDSHICDIKRCAR